jgi:hypothetical protein
LTEWLRERFGDDVDRFQAEYVASWTSEFVPGLFLFAENAKSEELFLDVVDLLPPNGEGVLPGAMTEYLSARQAFMDAQARLNCGWNCSWFSRSVGNGLFVQPEFLTLRECQH